jgi:hypothetical protein
VHSLDEWTGRASGERCLGKRVADRPGGEEGKVRGKECVGREKADNGGDPRSGIWRSGDGFGAEVRAVSISRFWGERGNDKDGPESEASLDESCRKERGPRRRGEDHGGPFTWVRDSHRSPPSGSWLSIILFTLYLASASPTLSWICLPLPV